MHHRGEVEMVHDSVECMEVLLEYSLSSEEEYILLFLQIYSI